MAGPDDLESVYQATSSTEGCFITNLLESEGVMAAVSEPNERLAGLLFDQVSLRITLSPAVRVRYSVA